MEYVILVMVSIIVIIELINLQRLRNIEIRNIEDRIDDCYERDRVVEAIKKNRFMPIEMTEFQIEGDDVDDGK